MIDQHITAAVVISFTTKLEVNSAAFYEQLAARFPEHRDRFLGYAKDCAASRVLVERTYQETITDALETGYAFEGLAIDEQLAHPQLAADASLAQALAAAVAFEDAAIAFYLDIADRSQSLLATIPGAFRRAAKTRDKRRSAMQTLAA